MFKDGDFVLVEYTATVKETGEVVDTTDLELAKKHNIYDETKEYGPALVIVGEGRFVKGFEEKLKELEEGAAAQFEVPPEKAYGHRDPGKVRRLPLREFKKADIEPVPGKVVEINGVPAVIRDVSGGRVTVDFNHPLAGKTLVYEVKVVKHVTSDEEKLRLLLKRRLRPKSLDAYAIALNKEAGLVEVVVPEDEMLNPNLQVAKKAFARDVFKYFDWVSKVVFKEILEPKKAKKEAQASEAAEAPEAKHEASQ